MMSSELFRAVEVCLMGLVVRFGGEVVWCCTTPQKIQGWGGVSEYFYGDTL